MESFAKSIQKRIENLTDHLDQQADNMTRYTQMIKQTDKTMYDRSTKADRTVKDNIEKCIAKVSETEVRIQE